MGANVADAWPVVVICSTSESIYGLTTELAGTTIANACTKAQWSSAVSKSDNVTQFDTKMSNVFGDHWDDFDTDDQAIIRKAFFDVKDAT